MNTIDERLHAFEVVCKTALKLKGLGSQASLHLKKAGGLAGLGESEFGLSAYQVKSCLGRARNFMAEVNERDKERNGK